MQNSTNSNQRIKLFHSFSLTVARIQQKHNAHIRKSPFNRAPQKLWIPTFAISIIMKPQYQSGANGEFQNPNKSQKLDRGNGHFQMFLSMAICGEKLVSSPRVDEEIPSDEANVVVVSPPFRYLFNRSKSSAASSIVGLVDGDSWVQSKPNSISSRIATSHIFFISGDWSLESLCRQESTTFSTLP